jgi:16S rRNA (uracil1498-N3)-methyltransferase
LSPVPLVHVTAVPATVGGIVELDTDTLHHLRRVLRAEDGAELELSDGRGTRAPARLGGTTAVVGSAPVRRAAPSPRLVLAQALPKGRRFDEVVRVAVELGVDTVVPVLAERSNVRLRVEDREDARRRWEAVARSAAAQSRREWLPDIAAPVAADGVGAAGGTLLVAVPGAASVVAQAAGLAAAEVVTVAIGPEGGWSEAERRVLAAAGGVEVGLGPTVLRTEHAGAAALAVVAALAGRWDAEPAPVVS